MKKSILFILAFWAYTLCALAETPVFQPVSVKKMDFEKNSKTFERLMKRAAQKDFDYNTLTEEEQSIYNETKDSYWDVIGGACSWYCAGGPSSVTASSQLKPQGAVNYKASNAHDLSYRTAWVEGVAGYGIGEYLTYSFKGGDPRITTIIVVNGYVKSGKAFKENSRVKKLKVYKDDKPIAILDLKDIMGEQRFEIGTLGDNTPGSPDWKLKFEIMEVYKGDKYDDTALSEIYFNGIDVHCLVKGTKITMADGSEKDIEEIKEGDEVLSYTTSNTTGKSTVKAIAQKNHTDFVTYRFKSGRSLTCTLDHPLFSPKFGWVSCDPEKSKLYKGFVNVGTVKIGTYILQSDGSDDQITAIEKGKKEQPSYTITELSDKHIGFFANGVCVGTEGLK
ncbi:MAG: hypothetical protein IK131_08865 [Paludibacteraceae bacterium]|nr:hypothetical protein [Paludibacteraceae bacterium]